MKIRMVAPALAALAVIFSTGGAQAQRVKGPKRLAVIVGVDNYVNAAGSLRGAVNDARLTRSMLVARGYAPVLLLTNQEASAARIRKALAVLAKAAGPRDHVYFHFSGYGNKEASGPAICAADYAGSNGISYREIQSVFKNIKSGKKTAVIDCSFVAGAPTRTTTVRYWPGTRGTRALVGPSLNKPAVETLVKAGRESKWQGALTWAFVRSMQTSAPRSSVKQLDGAMNARTAGKFRQKVRARDFSVIADAVPAPGATTPEVGGAAVGDGTQQADQVAEVVPDAGQTLEVVAEKVDDAIDAQPNPDVQAATFETVATGEPVPNDAPNAEALVQQVDQGQAAEQAAPQDPVATDNSGQAVTVDQTMGMQVTLSDGASSDLTPGTKLEADANNDGMPEGVVQVTDVGVDTATATVVEGMVPPDSQLEVVQTAPNPDDGKLAVEVVGVGMADTGAAQMALMSKAFLRVVSAGDVPERRVAIMQGMGGAVLAKVLPVDVAPDSANMADGKSGMDGASAVEAIRGDLVANFLYKRMALLNNPRSTVNVGLTVTGRNGANGADGLKIGDPVTFGVTVDKPAFITLIAIGPGGSFTMLLPNDFFKGDTRGTPGTPYMVPPASGGFALNATPPEGPTFVLAIVTSKPFDTTALNPQSIPNLRGIKQVPNPEIRGSRLRDIVVAQAGGESEADEWGSTFIVVPVFP